VSVVQDDDMIEQVSENAADHPLAVRILPRTSGRYLDLFNAHVIDSILE
jgi:hypothetical protein